MEVTLKKKWVRMLSTFVLGLFLSVNVLAQSGSTIDVKGTVTDDFGPVTGASITIKGTGTGTITDLDGKFSLKAPANATLVVSFVGYKAQELPVSAEMNIKMAEDTELLDEVIVVGYATGSKHTVAGSIERISKEDMNVGVVNTPLDALKGKVAGVNISKVGGDPTSGSSIRVRGTTSLTGGNDPLVIIDGVFGDLGMLNAISPNDIETFTILKDAAETAQYGSRGASGVIVVSTTKGKYGTSSISYDGTFGVESVYKNIKMLDAAGYRAAVDKLGIANAVDGGADTNFMEEMQELGYTQNHRLSFGGGTEMSNYRASIGMVDQEGIIKNNFMKNYTAKIDLSQFFFDKKLQLEMGMFGSKKEQRYVNNYHKTFYSAAAFNPTLPKEQNIDGTWPEDVNANEVDNPLGRLTIDDREDNAYLNTNARITWNIIDGLKLSAFGSYTYNNKENSKHLPNNIKEGIREKGLAEISVEKHDNLMGNVSLEFKKKINQHAFNFLGLVEGQKYMTKKHRSTARGFATNEFGTDLLEAGALVKWGDVSSWKGEHSILSFMGRFNYVYNDKYIATVNLRGDGSSKLGSDKKWGFFPSASLAWNMEQEEFMKNLSFVDNFKVRAGYGVTGNQDAIESYNSMRLLAPSSVITVNGEPTVAFTYMRNDNQYLQWETKKMFNVGFDGAFINGLLDVTFDYYYSKTTNLLYNYDVPTPPFLHNKLLANAGEMSNAGIELAVTVSPIKTKDMDLSISVNGAFQKNKIISLGGQLGDQELIANEYWAVAGVSGAGAIGGNNNVVYNPVGESIGTFYLPKATGLVNDGLGSYGYNILDLDGDGVVSMDNDGDRYIAGQAIPKFFLGSNINFRYKQFDFQTQLNGAFGHKIYNGTHHSFMNMNIFPTYNVLEGAPEMNIRDKGANGEQNRVSDYWLEKGDYLNIAYITVGYNVNTEKFNKWIKSLRISASVNNVHTFTNYKGLSPMINSATMGDDFGVDDKRFYPLSRTYSIGLNVTF